MPELTPPTSSTFGNGLRPGVCAARGVGGYREISAPISIDPNIEERPTCGSTRRWRLA